MTQWIVVAGTVFITAGTLPGGELPQRYEFRAAHMGTFVELTLYASGKDLANRAAQAAFARIEQLDECLSDYRSDSELRKLCVILPKMPRGRRPLRCRTTCSRCCTRRASSVSIPAARSTSR